MNRTPKWAFITLMLAGLYNLLWGAWVIVFPKLSFTILNATPPEPIQIWQCVGMIVGVYGIGYIIAATDPNRHWPIVLVGFLGKLFGPIGFAKALVDETFPLTFGLNIIFNDLIWWIPFFYLLKNAYDHHFNDDKVFKADLERILTKDSKTLLVAIRHYGCCFSKENLSLLFDKKNEYEKHNVAIKIIHMGSNEELKNDLDNYSLKDVEFISDPNRNYYAALGFIRGKLDLLFSIKSTIKAFNSILKGHAVGPLRGDGFQLGGMALYDGNKKLFEYISHNSHDSYPHEECLKNLRMPSK